MIQEELISKKELLLKTGISYGQLYRWKRQNLIPNAWFMKQSSYTGQETFFPRHKVLDRIHTILEMKDSHSLEDLATFFAPESVNRTYVLLDAMEAIGLESMDVELCIQLWGKYRVTFMELLLLSLLAELRQDAELMPDDRRAWLLTARKWADKDSRVDRVVVVFRKESALTYLLLDSSCRYDLDDDSGSIATYDLSERSKQLQFKLHTITEG